MSLLDNQTTKTKIWLQFNTQQCACSFSNKDTANVRQHQ